MSKFTAAKLVEFYQKVADGGVMEFLISSGEEYLAHPKGPTFADNTEHWRIKPAKKKKKIIDLEPLIASGIDCEFSNFVDNDEEIGPLLCLDDRDDFKYEGRVLYFQKCRPRMNYKMCHDGSKPIEGFVATVYFASGGSEYAISTSDPTVYWRDVKAIEYLEVEDGYAYPWEQAE